MIFLKMNKTNAPTGAWEVKIPAFLGTMTTQPNNRPTNQPTDDGRTEGLIG